MTRIIKADAVRDEAATPAGVLNLTDIAAQARSIILEARKEAARITGQAREQSQDAQQAAGKKGYAEGFARGQSDGYTNGQKQACEAANRQAASDASELAGLLKKMIEGFEQERSGLMQQARAELLEFALELAGRIVGQISVSQPFVAQASLSRALAIAHGRAAMTIHVSPQQLEMLTQQCAELTESMGPNSSVRLVADESVVGGGVKIVTSQGQIDATIHAQWDSVVEVVLGPGTKRAIVLAPMEPGETEADLLDSGEPGMEPQENQNKNA